jgi:hypothetical protein
MPGPRRRVRVPGGALVPVEHSSPEAVAAQDAAYDEFLDTVDVRTNRHLQFSLSSATDARFRAFVEKIASPKFARRRMSVVANLCNISLAEFADFWRKSQLQRGMTMAIDAIPKLTGDLIGDAASRIEVCERCDGLGEVEDGEDKRGRKKVRPCPNCQGVGTNRKPGDTHARDKLLEMTGVVGKRGGAAVVINQNFAGMGIDTASSRLDAITFDVSGEDVSDSDNAGSGAV